MLSFETQVEKTLTGQAETRLQLILVGSSITPEDTQALHEHTRVLHERPGGLSIRPDPDESPWNPGGTGEDTDKVWLLLADGGTIHTHWVRGLDESAHEIYVQLREDGMPPHQAHICAEQLERENT